MGTEATCIDCMPSPYWTFRQGSCFQHFKNPHEASEAALGLSFGSSDITTLLELNYAASIVNSYGGFKHLPTPTLFDGREWAHPEDPILGAVKDPWASLVAMWRYVDGVRRQHVFFSTPWSRFIESPLVVSFGGRPDFPEQPFASPYRLLERDNSQPALYRCARSHCPI